MIDRGETSQTNALRAIQITSYGSVVGFICSLIFGIFMARKISKALQETISRLGHETSNTKNSSENVAAASSALAQATSEQAAALQETAASIEEMSAMISKNSQNAESSAKVALTTIDAVGEGRESAEMIVKAMNNIHVSNEGIMKQVEDSNLQISEISKVISEIGDKTKVINDIVFQTKLLSFNASVEAARAGESGKGFAVVAEEIGKLAAMSGSAAFEITQMIESSIKKVHEIVENTKKQMQINIQEGRTQLSTGIKVVKSNQEILENIASKMNEVNSMIREIAMATDEQSTGVNEISKAMMQLDQVTNRNSEASHNISEDSEKLKQQALSLELVLVELQALVWGSRS